MDRGAWWAAVHGVAKSWTRLRDCAQHNRRLPFSSHPSQHLSFAGHFGAEEKHPKNSGAGAQRCGSGQCQGQEGG